MRTVRTSQYGPLGSRITIYCHNRVAAHAIILNETQITIGGGDESPLIYLEVETCTHPQSLLVNYYNAGSINIYKHTCTDSPHQAITSSSSIQPGMENEITLYLPIRKCLCKC